MDSRAPYVNALVHRYFPKDRDVRVIDLGCGAGAVVRYLQSIGYRNVSGVDVAQRKVDEARRRGARCVELGDLRETIRNTPTQSIDVLITFDVLEHLTKEEVLEVARCAYRSLKSGGRWIAHVPNGASPFFGAVRYGDWSHCLAFTATSLSEVFSAAGFEAVRCVEDTPVVHGTGSAIRWIMWKMIHYALRLYTAAETGYGGADQIFSRNLLAIAVKT